MQSATSYKVNEKFKQAIFNFNKRNFINILIITTLCGLIYGALLLKKGDLLLAILIFGCSLSSLYLANYINKLILNSRKILVNIHNLVFCGASFFFPTFLIVEYYNGMNFQQAQKIFYIAFGFMKILFSIRLFRTKVHSYLFTTLYSVNICFLIYLFYFLYGYDQFASYFQSFDALYALFSIVIIYSITYSRHTFYDEFNKVVWENEFYIEKYNGMFKHLITPIIKIDKENYIINLNDSIQVFLEKIIANKEDLQGFLDISDKAIEQFKKETKLTEEFQQFYKNLRIKNESSCSTKSSISNTSIKSLNLFEINDLKIDIFYKRLYYLDKIFKYFKSNQIKPPTTLDISKKKNFIKSNMFDILFSVSSNITEEKYKKVGNFYVNPTDNLSTKMTFDMLFRKSDVFGVEYIDILFYDTSAVSKIEKEKANAEVESRKQYLTLVSDKFMTPVQVLLLCIKDIAKQIKNKNKIDPNSLVEIKTLGTLIQIMNQDLTFMSRIESGIDINFENFKTNKLFNTSKEIIDLLIRNNPTKCYAIKTKLVISPEVPSVLNSDINRLRQVLVSFLSNAYKFTLAGIIKITVKVKESTSLYDEIVVSINDSGIGIRDEYKEALLSQISEIKDLKKLQLTGHGFGLIMSNSIISRLGKSVKYEPKKFGSIFSFSFYNIKSEDIEFIIKKDNFQKMKDLIEIKLLHSSARKVTTKIESISELEIELKINNKHYMSSNNLATKSVNIDQENLLDKNKKLIYVNSSSSGSKKENCELKNEITEVTSDINSVKIIQEHFIDYEDNQIFDVDQVQNLNYDCDKEFKMSFLNKKLNSNTKIPIRYANSNLILPFEKVNSDKFFNFGDSVFDAYKINIDDSIYLDTKNSMEINTSSLVTKLVSDSSSNKYSALFNEISEISKKHHENLEFLKIYENFKPYFKFFYRTLKKGDFDIKPSVNNVKRILLVDDNKPILKALKNITKIVIKDLKMTDKVEILKAYDGVDALALFKIDHYTSQSISCIISDHNMSMMNGHDFINLVNNYKLGRDIKLYISSTDNEIIKTNKLKNVQFINKPARKSDIKNVLSNIII